MNLDLEQLIDDLAARLAPRVAELVAERIEARLNAPTSSAPDHLDTKAAAKYLGRSEQFLEIARHRGGGPRYSQPGGARGRVVYRRSDLDAYVANGLRDHTPPQPQPKANGKGARR